MLAGGQKNKAGVDLGVNKIMLEAAVGVVIMDLHQAQEQ